VDAGAYKTLCTNVNNLLPGVPEIPLKSEDLTQLLDVIREFGRYHQCADAAIRDQITGWRELVGKLLAELLARSDVNASSAEAAPLVQGVATLLTGAEIQSYQAQLSEFLRVKSIGRQASNALQKQEAARAASNDNPSGLFGATAAVAHMKTLLNTGGKGYVVVFTLSCPDSIIERHGKETMQDCMMAISAFLARSLRSEDRIFYWSEDSLLAVLQSPADEKVMTAAVQRIVDNNRDITLQIGVRVVMLRVPLLFEVTPISKLQSAEDLYNLPRKKSMRQNCKDAIKSTEPVHA